MSAWRQAGLTYINYSTIAARVLRRSLKPDELLNAEKRGVSNIRLTSWADGKPVKQAQK